MSILNRKTDSIFKDSGVLWLVLHAHSARKAPSGAGVVFDLKSSIGYLLRIGSWATGLKVERIVAGVVHAETTLIRAEFLRELGMLPDTHALRPWLSGIPPLGLSYAVGFDFGQLEALRLLQLAPQAADLIPTNPVLLWLVAWTMAQRCTPPDEAAKIASGARRDLAEWCGGVNSKACVRMIEKFDPPSSLYWVERIRKAIANPETVALSAHYKTPFTGSYMFRVEPELRQLNAFQAELNDATRTSGPGSLLGLLRDTRKLAELLERDVTQSLHDCPNAEAIKGLHERLLVDLYTTDPPKLRELRRGTESFGRPPVAGTADIEPIRSATELVAEGELMGHCCATHAWSVRKGETYFYRVLRPQRATLEVATFKGHVWLYELKLKQNAEPAEETYEFVRRWLRSRQQQTTKQAP